LRIYKKISLGRFGGDCCGGWTQSWL